MEIHQVLTFSHICVVLWFSAYFYLVYMYTIFFLWTLRGWSCIYFTLTILVSIFYKQWYSHMLTLRLLNSGNLTWSDTLIYYTSVCYLDYLKSLSLDFFSPPCDRGFSLGSHIVFVVMSFLTSNSYLAVLCLPWQ